jgi:hypothetical protein
MCVRLSFRSSSYTNEENWYLNHTWALTTAWLGTTPVLVGITKFSLYLSMMTQDAEIKWFSQHCSASNWRYNDHTFKLFTKSYCLAIWLEMGKILTYFISEMIGLSGLTGLIYNLHIHDKWQKEPGLCALLCTWYFFTSPHCLYTCNTRCETQPVCIFNIRKNF